MSELKVASCFEFEKVLRGRSNKLFYSKSEVDAVLDEKDKIIAELKEQYKDMDVTHTVHIAKMNAKIEELESKNAQLEDDVAFWKKKLSSCLNGDCILTCDTVEKYGKENVRLKRALYKACANWAQRQHLDYYHQLHLGVPKSLLPGLEKGIDCWKKMERKCRAMAEKFK